MTAYYNENDKQTCAWLRELIKQDLIAPGDVDERDIRDVKADELIRYAQIHFFAGIGVWSYALRNAGWPDDRPVLTGSCPCQPFSGAGKKTGTKDKRHLWPEMFRLIAGLPKSKRPPTIFGEQVAQKAGQAWFDVVQADLARENYAAGLVVFPACSVGAPHLRQRLYWFADYVDDSDSTGRFGPDGRRILGRGETAKGQRQAESAVSGVTNPLEQSNRDGRQQRATCNHDGRKRQRPTDQQNDRHEVRNDTGDTEPADGVADNNCTGVERKSRNTANQSRAMETRGQGSKSIRKSGNNSPTDGVADGDGKRSQRHRQKFGKQQHAQGRQITSGYSAESCDTHGVEQSNRLSRRAKQKSGQSARGKCRQPTGNISDTDGAGPTNGYWRAADWIWCRDEKWRPTEPGVAPLVDGSSARMVRLRGYGNAIVAPQAQAFIESYLETE
jgi:DNA (cytosine-5)-methyltransferase 1